MLPMSLPTANNVSAPMLALALALAVGRAAYMCVVSHDYVPALFFLNPRSQGTSVYI